MTNFDSTLANALARRDAALAEANKWSEFVRMYEEVRPKRSSDGAPPEMGAKPPTLPKPSVRSAVKGMETETAAGEIIAQRGVPVPTRELLKALVERGIKIGGKDPISTLTARLSRAPSLENLKRHGWCLKALKPEIGAAGSVPAGMQPADSDPGTTSSPVKPAAGGGT